MTLTEAAAVAQTSRDDSPCEQLECPRRAQWVFVFSMRCRHDGFEYKTCTECRDLAQKEFERLYEQSPYCPYDHSPMDGWRVHKL